MPLKMCQSSVRACSWFANFRWFLGFPPSAAWLLTAQPKPPTATISPFRTCSALRSGRGCRRRHLIDDAVVVREKDPGIAIEGRPRPLRQHGGVPALPIGFQAIEHVTVAVLQVAPLARIPDHIEEKFVSDDLQILPVAVADRAL